MSDLIEVVGLGPVLKSAGIRAPQANIETIYRELAASPSHVDLLRTVETRVRTYFEALEIPDDANFYDF
ncbi:MAG: hypothetical protein MUO23_14925, partial [Anaerolineales bacterium]|nr:hypothetical protein [Anaerolineales bacterium]